MKRNFPGSFRLNNSGIGRASHSLSEKKFEIRCAKDKDMDVSMLAFAGVADVLSGNISFLTTAEFPNA